MPCIQAETPSVGQTNNQIVSPAYQALLTSTFGLTQLKPAQQQAVEAILAGQDILAVLPTGTGKSLIYQLSGLVLPGVTLVISPLLALMFDQVHQLQEKGIEAASWNCLTPPAMKQQLLRRLRAQQLRFLYLSPEKLRSPLVSAVLKTQPISLIAVDEAHCVTQWSAEFRPQYGQIDHWIRWYSRFQPRPRLAAFTATTTPQGATDIGTKLGLIEPNLISLPCFRPNLRYQIIPVPSENWKRQILKHILSIWETKLDGVALLYAATRLDVVWLTHWLRANGFEQAEFFHAGLPPQQKAQLLQRLATGERILLVATNAFGLGIDLPQVRLVIHHCPPANVSAFVQEAGRAGRNGQEAFAVVLYHQQQWLDTLEFLLASDDVVIRQRKWQEARAMWQFLRRTECLSRQLVRYFRLPSTPRCSLKDCGCQYCQPDFPWNP